MPLYFLLIIYLVLFSIWLIFSLLILGHLIKYGGPAPANIMVVFLYIVGSCAIIFLTYYFMSMINWQDIINIMPNASGPSYKNYY